jgi:hypothetical protein
MGIYLGLRLEVALEKRRYLFSPRPIGSIEEERAFELH